MDQTVQGQGLGGFLLVNAFRRCLGLGDQLGIHGVEVDAIDDPARAFYQRYGFVELSERPLHLFLKMTDIEQAFGASVDE